MMKRETEASYQNFERYSKGANGVYYISAQADAVGGAEIKPVVIAPIEPAIPDDRLETVFYNSVGGIIVVVDNMSKYWTTPEVKISLGEADDRNPHWTYRTMSSVWKDEPIGHTIPRITITTANILNQIESQKERGRKAGVAYVEWSTAALIEQVQWTLTDTDSAGNPLEHPKDGYALYDLALKGDYRSPLRVLTFSKDIGPFDPGAWSSHMDEYRARINALRGDFKRIKAMFNDGVPPSSHQLGTVWTAPDLEGEIPEEGLGGFAATQTPGVMAPVSSKTVVLDGNDPVISEINGAMILTNSVAASIIEAQRLIAARLEAAAQSAENLWLRNAFDTAGNRLLADEPVKNIITAPVTNITTNPNLIRPDIRM